MIQTITTDGGNSRGVVVGDNRLEVAEDGVAIQKFGDRGTNNYSKSDVSYTVSSNPMSDREQMVVVDDKYYLSDKGVKFVLDPKRGMCTDVNADVAQTLTAKG